MKTISQLLLLVFCSFSAMAEHKDDTYKTQIYSKGSSSKLNKLNESIELLKNPSKILKKIRIGDDSSSTKKDDKPIEKLRDPTKMSGNFRQALKSIRPISNTSRDNTMPKIPDISLAAKVLGRKKASSIILKVNKRSLHIFEGKSASLVENNKVITIRVDAIKKSHVTISISPHNEQLILQ